MPNDSSPTPTPARRRGFATTHWSLVMAAGQGGSADAERALADLCAQYWPPLYAYARRRGYEVEDARDLTQAFFAKLLEKQDLRAADPARGRFRTFLLSSMKNFLAGEWRRDHAQKRGGAALVVPLDVTDAERAYGTEPAHQLGPEAVYERRWALEVLARVVADLRGEYSRSGKAELFDALKDILNASDATLPYADLARQLGQTEGALRTAASRLRSRWRHRLREIVAETVSDETEVEDELRRLAGAVRSGV